MNRNDSSGQSGPGALPDDLPPSGRTIQPILWKIIESWHRREAEIASWEDAERLLPPNHDGWAALAERLQLINTFQWHEEDKSRDRSDNDTRLAAVKRSIDASNRRRVKAVEAFDRFLHARLTRAGLLAEAAPLHSESPGSIVDRITVLALKVFHVREALTAARRETVSPETTPDKGAGAAEPAPDPELADLYQRLRSLTEQLVDLTECLDRLLADIAAGRIRFKLYEQVKVYRDSASGRLRSE